MQRPEDDAGPSGAVSHLMWLLMLGTREMSPGREATAEPSVQAPIQPVLGKTENLGEMRRESSPSPKILVKTSHRRETRVPESVTTAQGPSPFPDGPCNFLGT